MKRETLRHPKTLDLAARLNRSRPEVLGFLSLLWDFAAEFTPAGDIGKHTDGTIARACDWNGDPSEFIDALLAAGWIDRDPDHRLLIHDWHDHCERWVHLKLQRLGLQFATSLERSTEPSTDAATERSTEPSASRDLPYPTQTKPNLPKPIARATGQYSAAFEAWYAVYPRHVGKDKAAAAYGRAIQRIASARGLSATDAHLWLLSVTQVFAASPAGRSSESPGDLKYVPYPATWLNAGRFNDDQSEWRLARLSATTHAARPRAVRSIADDPE